MTENTKKIKLLTVHGTWAGIPSEETPHWWQSTSFFSQKIKTALLKKKVDAEIIPFLWSGENSSYHRSVAAQNLKKTLGKMAKGGESIHLIGHSHGGSVIEEALEQMRWKGDHKSVIKSISTIGTPFFQRSTSTIRKVAVGLTFLLLCLLILMFTAAALINKVGGSDYLIFMILMIPGIFFISRYFLDILPPVRTEKPVFWQAIWHPNDEAISALSQVEHQKLESFSANSVKKSVHYFFENMLMFSILFIGVGLVLLTLNKQAVTVALIVFMNIPFFWIVSAVLLIFMAKPMAKRLNGKIAGILKNVAFGQDSSKRLHNVQTLPHLYRVTAVSLSAKTIEKMLSSAQQKLANFIISNHSSMTLIHSTKAQSEGLSRTLIALDGGELVHTSYFEQEEIFQLVFDHIKKAEEEIL